MSVPAAAHAKHPDVHPWTQGRWSALLAGRFGTLRNLLGPRIRAALRQRIDDLQSWVGPLGATRMARDPADATRFFIGPVRIRPDDRFIELDIEVRLTWAQTRPYRGSKLYYRTGTEPDYSEAHCLFFWLHRNGEPERLRLVLPESARDAGWMMLRLDVLPGTDGVATLHGCRIAGPDDPDEALDNAATLHAMKLRTDREVVTSIETGRQVLPHYPQALSMEIQPNCNLTCAHCPTHGKPELHAECNALKEMDVGLLDKIAHEVFPHVDCVNLVGRGEPTHVSDRLWTALVDHLVRYGVMLVVVTNGTTIKRRFTERLLPLVETLSVSIDGANPDTFARNRGGASFKHVMEGVAHFHALRQSACLPRRPKLSISWTIKNNNVAELPGFVRYMAQFEPDKYFFRYMVMCEELETDQSPLEDPEAANGYLRDAYAFLEEQGVEVVRPPLFEVAGRGGMATTPVTVSAAWADEGAAPGAGVAPAVPAATFDAADTAPEHRCPHMFAEGAILSGGQIMSCQAYFAESVGDMNTVPDYMSAWSGPRMQSLRAGLGAGTEWGQCGECWISQMRCYSPDVARPVRVEEPLTPQAKKVWDLRDCTRR